MKHVQHIVIEKGQGLLEAIIAVAIISVGISGVISLAGNNLIASNISSQELIAINLAREGVEVITNLRDSNYLDIDATWNDGLETVSSNDDGIIQYNSVARSWSVNFLTSNTTFANAETALYWDPNLSMYVQGQSVGGSWETTPYARRIEINRICDDDVTDFTEGAGCSGQVVGYRVLSEVQWTERGNSRSVSVEKRIFNWR